MAALLGSGRFHFEVEVRKPEVVFFAVRALPSLHGGGPVAGVGDGDKDAELTEDTDTFLHSEAPRTFQESAPGSYCFGEGLIQRALMSDDPVGHGVQEIVEVTDEGGLGGSDASHTHAPLGDLIDADQW